MHLVILLLAFLAFFIYLTLGARNDPEKRKLFYLFVLIDLWLAAVFAAVMGPASYWFGTSLTEAQLGLPILTSLAIMAVGWGLLFPCGIYYAGKLKA